MANRRRKKNRFLDFLLSIILFALIGFLCYRIYDDKIKPNNTDKVPKVLENKKEKEDTKGKEEKTNTNTEKSKEESEGPMKTEEEETKKERDKNISINMELIGEEEITIKKGDKYTDPGVKATDNDGNDMSDEIEIVNNVNTNKTGKYSVIYSYGKNIIIRTVIVE